MWLQMDQGPKYTINEETLLNFRDLGFSWNEISKLMLVSRWTIYRRVNELGIKDVTGFSNLTDSALDEINRNFRETHGLTAGRSIILGHLRALGLRVQQHRVTKSLARVDPETSRLR